MPAYVIGAIEAVHDPDLFMSYQQKAGPTINPFRGRVVCGGSNIEVADGNWSPAGVVVIEFPTMELAKAWYNGPAYTNARPDRLNSADSGLIFLDMSGTPPLPRDSG